MLFGAQVSLAQWRMWNQIPVRLGNFVSGALLTGLALYVTNSSKKTATLESPLVTKNLGALRWEVEANLIRVRRIGRKGQKEWEIQ